MQYPTLIEIREPGVIYMPSHDFLLVLPVERPNITPGGLIMPEAANSLLGRYGKVVAAGPGNHSPMGVQIPMDHKMGDMVVIPPGAMHSLVKICGVTYWQIHDFDASGVLVQGELEKPEVPVAERLTLEQFRDLFDRKAIPAKFELVDADGAVLADDTTSPARIASILSEARETAPV